MAWRRRPLARQPRHRGGDPAGRRGRRRAAWAGITGAAARPLQRQRDPGQPDAGVRGRPAAVVPGLRPWKDPGANFPQTITFDAIRPRCRRLIEACAPTSACWWRWVRRRPGLAVPVPHLCAASSCRSAAWHRGGALCPGFSPRGAVDGPAGVGRHGRAGWRARGRGPAGPAHALRAGGLRLRRDHRRLVGRLHRWASSSRRC